MCCKCGYYIVIPYLFNRNVFFHVELQSCCLKTRPPRSAGTVPPRALGRLSGGGVAQIFPLPQFFAGSPGMPPLVVRLAGGSPLRVDEKRKRVVCSAAALNKVHSKLDELSPE